MSPGPLHEFRTASDERAGPRNEARGCPYSWEFEHCKCLFAFTKIAIEVTISLLHVIRFPFSLVHFPSYIFVFLNNGQRSGSQEMVWEKLTHNKQWPCGGVHIDSNLEVR